jgi:type I restriction enzyme R subunit
MIVRTRLHSTASGTNGAKKPALKGVLGMMMMNEAETRARLVEPTLKAAGWTDNLLAREFIYSRDYQFTEGKVILIGDEVQRGRKKKVDYLLRYSDGFPIAVVEAEPANSPPEAGLEQAKGYARDLGLAFAYSTNGHEIVEYDFFTHSSRSLKEFPRPQELWERWKANTGLEKPTPGRVKEAPLVYGISEEISKAFAGSVPFTFRRLLSVKLSFES